MGNCDSCLGGRERPKPFDEPVQRTPSSTLSSPMIHVRNEIQYVNSGANSPGFGVHHRILPFDRRPSIKIPEPVPEKPRKPYGI